MKSSTLKLYCDGGARGNPGPGALGVVMFDADGKELARLGKSIGEVTNNVAEYCAVLEAFNYLSTHKTPVSCLEFYLDSLLVTQQLKGKFKIKMPKLQNLHTKIKILEKKVGLPVQYINIPRGQNRIADGIVNAVLDGYFTNTAKSIVD